MDDIAHKHVAVLVDNYFEQAEFEEPVSALKNVGAEVTVIATGDKKLQGLQHVKLGDKFQADLLLREASSDDYDALVLPGGAINADALRMNEAAQCWAMDFMDSGKPLAVICHAPWLLVSADIVEGKRLTSYNTIQDDIRNAGGEWIDRAVVTDGNLITSRQPDDLPAFNDALITMLHEPATDEITIEGDMRLQALGYDKRRDELTDEDEREILADEDEADPDELHPSSVSSGERRNER